MDDTAPMPIPKPFVPHPNLSDEVNRNIVQSEIEGGVCLNDLSEGVRLELETQHRWYTILIRDRGKELIWGHPQYCPDPVPVRIAGSTWGGSMLKLRFIGRGMHLEFCHPVIRTIETSRILDVRASDQLASYACAARKLTVHPCFHDHLLRMNFLPWFASRLRDTILDKKSGHFGPGRDTRQPRKQGSRE